MLVEISHGSVSFGAEVILSDINFMIKNTEKIAIVGRNGCGKTTLLYLISGRTELDKKDSEQEVFIARRGGLTVGYLQQNAFEDDLKTFHPEFEPAKESYTDAFNVRKLQIGYGKSLAEISLEQKKGEKIGIIGGNGCGKSTFLKTLIGQAEPIRGEFSFGGNVEIGYFDQQMAQYESDGDVLTDFCSVFPDFTNNEARTVLGAFLFSEDDVYKNVRMLSGGEKVRLALCKIMSGKPNFLILDEPTNHMDILSKEVLGNMLKNYTGTVLFVSHDRYFIRQVADTLMVFEDGIVRCDNCFLE